MKRVTLPLCHSTESLIHLDWTEAAFRAKYCSSCATSLCSVSPSDSFTIVLAEYGLLPQTQQAQRCQKEEKKYKPWAPGPNVWGALWNCVYKCTPTDCKSWWHDMRTGRKEIGPLTTTKFLFFFFFFFFVLLLLILLLVVVIVVVSLLLFLLN